MIPVEQARATVRDSVEALAGTAEVALADALDRVLAAPVPARRDDPPFAKALMDGWACRSADLAPLPARLRVVGRIAAGDAELPRVGPGETAWINTGAPLPPGADCVVPVEESRGEGELLARVEPGTHVLPAGTLVRAGEAVAAGRLTPERIAACAAQGHDPVAVRPRPRVAVLATGTELRADPGAHEIRDSNRPMLCALVRRAGGEPVDLGTAPDDEEELAARLRAGLEADLLVTTGGVSKGDRDLVRPALEALGVGVVFHGVALQPGKPVLFGAHPGGHVFALPGNPASALVCADLFVLPALGALEGRGFDAPLRTREATVRGGVRANPKRTRVLPCRLRGDGVEPLPWRSSADVYTLGHASGYVVVEPGRDLADGDRARVLVPERFAPGEP